MSENKALRDFRIGFNELDENNQKCIIAVQQALIFAQSSANMSPGETGDGEQKREEVQKSLL